MRPNRLTWAIVVTLAALSTQCSKEGTTPTSPSPSPSPTSGAIAYTAIGASDGIGVGGSVVCAPFDTGCENGTGYVQTLRRRLQATGRTVTYRNLSVPGQVMSSGIEDLAVQIGRSRPGNLLERQAPFVPAGTTHVTIFAGGNDANIIAQNVLAGAGGADPRSYVDARVREWGASIADLVAHVRAIAPSARIVALNLPNLAAAPYVSGNSVNERAALQRIAVGLADRVNALTSRNVLVVDLLCDARIIAPSSFSSDGFHPSDAGYALMAELTYPALADGNATTPSGSCAPRTVFPTF